MAKKRICFQIVPSVIRPELSCLCFVFICSLIWLSPFTSVIHKKFFSRFQCYLLKIYFLIHLLSCFHLYMSSQISDTSNRDISHDSHLQFQIKHIFFITGICLIRNISLYYDIYFLIETPLPVCERYFPYKG